MATQVETALANWVKKMVPGQSLVFMKHLGVINENTAVIDFGGPQFTLTVQFDWESGSILSIKVPRRMFPKQEGSYLVGEPDKRLTEMLCVVGVLSMKKTIRVLSDVGRKNSSETPTETGE
jgi:hypothetical protein